MKLLEKYALKRLRRKAASTERQVRLPNPDKIRKAAVIWQPSQKEACQFLHDHFSQYPVIFRNLCVYSENPTINTGTDAITPKDLNWLGFPKPGFVENFLNTEFDLLLNIAMEQTLLLDYLTALSKARFKIGWSPQQDNYFDLNINISRNKDAMYLARQQIFYLAQLNKRT